jgi:hypothetical protein
MPQCMLQFVLHASLAAALVIVSTRCLQVRWNRSWRLCLLACFLGLLSVLVFGALLGVARRCQRQVTASVQLNSLLHCSLLQLPGAVVHTSLGDVGLCHILSRMNPFLHICSMGASSFSAVLKWRC